MRQSYKYHTPTTLGYMPLKSSYGFLTPQATTRDAAHELGHGKFNLRHTFSEHNPIVLKKGSTQNLMDYSIGTELFKYQWDLIHNPEGGWFVFEDEEEGAIKNYLCRSVNLDYFPSNFFSDVPKNTNELISYIESNNLWIPGQLNQSLNSVREDIMNNYFMYYDQIENDYYFHQDRWNSEHEGFNNINDWRNKKIKDEVRFYLIREKHDALLFNSRRAVKCGTYNEEIAISQYNQESKFLLDHFSSDNCNNGNCVYNWVNGKTSYIPDPRMYYDYTNDDYRFDDYKVDLREALYNLKDHLISNNSENMAELEFHQNKWLSRIAEFMCMGGASQIPNLTNQAKLNEIKGRFKTEWKNADPYGFYWEWNTLKEQRIEVERQVLLTRLQEEEVYRQYLLNAENKAILAMVTGDAGAVGGVVVMVIFPPTTVIGAIAGVVDVGFSIASFAEGYSIYSDIQDGFFDLNKTYNVIEGVLCSISPEYGSLFFNIAEYVSGVTSIATGFQNIIHLKSITGKEIETIVRGITLGNSTVTIGQKTYFLKQK